MRRREYFAVGGTLLIAGCTGGGDGGDDSGGGAEATPEPETGDDQPSTPYPEPETETFEGHGDTGTDIFSPKLAGPTAIAVSHGGSGNFSVWLLSQAGEQLDLVANVIGGYDGVFLYGLEQAKGYSFNIEADGNWVVEVRNLPLFESGEDPTGQYGRDFASFIGPLAFDGGERVTFSAESDSNHAVWLKNKFGEDFELLFNEVGRQDGLSTRITASGVGYIDIETEGPWDLKIEG